jgi:hypothetical protein
MLNLLKFFYPVCGLYKHFDGSAKEGFVQPFLCHVMYV